MKSRVKMKSRGKTTSRGKGKTLAPAKSKAAASRKGLKPRTVAKPAPAPKADPLDNWIVAGASGLGLKVEKSWMRAVRANLRVTLDQAAIVAEFPLPDDAEPAPVFRA